MATRKKAAKKKAAKKKAAGGGRYTKPALRETIKKRVLRGSRGGRAGQWSARKAQLVASEYKKAGGGYRGGKGGSQRHLDEWTGEAWQTREGAARARKGKTTKRYLPKKAWRKLSKTQAAATDRKKQAGSRKGKQFVANTAAAKRAGRAATGRKKTAARR